MDHFLQTYRLLQLTQGEIDNLNNSVTFKEIEFAIWNHQKKVSVDPEVFTGEFCQMFKEELIPVPPSLFQKIEMERKLPNLFYEISITLLPKLNTLQKRKL